MVFYRTSIVLILFIVISIFVNHASHAAPFELDNPPTQRQLDYSPADGAAVATNPPPFIWVPPQKNLIYSFQIKSDSSNDSIIEIKDISISTYALDRLLQEGTYSWRYGVQSDNAKTKWSKWRSFTVPESAQKFVKSDIKTILTSVPQSRPHMFVLKSELQAFRNSAKSGDLQSIANSLRRACDGYLGENLVPEPPYVEGSGAERGKNYQKIFRETRPPMDRMEQSALAYLLTGERKYGDEAKRRILHFFSWNPKGSTAYKNNDEPAMWVMMRGTRAYDWTYDLFTPEERRKVEPVMRIRAQQFYDHLKDRRQFHTDPFESHAGRTLGFLGEAALSFANQWPEAREWLDYVLTLFWNVYPAWGKEDGGWHEGPSYWSYYMGFALNFVVPLQKATGIDLMQKPFFQNTPYYKLYTNPPYAKISPFGDGEHTGPNSGMGQLMYHFSSLLDNPYFRWYADAKRSGPGASILGVVLKDDALKAKVPTDLPRSRYFPGVGLVSLHTQLGDAKNDVHFLIHSDPYGAISHAHADQNAFTLEAFGEPLAIASGYYPWYGSKHHANWQWHSKSSNTITFDGGGGQKIRNPNSKGKILQFETNDRFDYVKADAAQAYAGELDRFIRHVVHINPGVFVIYDELESPKERQYEWRLHARSPMDLKPDENKLTVSQGDARLLVQFLKPERVTIYQTTGFDDPPEHGEKDQFHAVVSPAVKTKSARFLTALIPYRSNELDKAPLVHNINSDREWDLKIETDSGIFTVQFDKIPNHTNPENGCNCKIFMNEINSTQQKQIFSTN